MNDLSTIPAPAVTLQGFYLTPEAQESIDAALSRGALIGRVITDAHQSEAVEAQRACKTLVNKIEEVRKQLTKPALDFQRSVMDAARAASNPLETEYGRLGDLVAGYQALERRRAAQAAEKIERERREAEEKARQERLERERAAQAAAEAERKRIEAENAARLEALRNSPEALAAEAERAEKARLAAEAARQEEVKRIAEREAEAQRHAAQQAAMQLQANAARTVAGQTVREDWEITVHDPVALGLRHPSCVEFKPKLTAIRAMLDSGITDLPGVVARRVVKSSVRTSGRTLELS